MHIGGRGTRSIFSTPPDRDEYGTQHSDELWESLRRPAYVFTVSCGLANTVKKDVGLSHDKRFRIVVSVLRKAFRSEENISLTWLPIHLHVADPPDEHDGQGYSR